MAVQQNIHTIVGLLTLNHHVRIVLVHVRLGFRSNQIQLHRDARATPIKHSTCILVHLCQATHLVLTKPLEKLYLRQCVYTIFKTAPHMRAYQEAAAWSKALDIDVKKFWGGED